MTENAARGTARAEREYELVDTGVFDERRYFDVVVEYAKASTDDILMQVTVHNRGPDAAPLHLLPQFWSRNTWTWVPGRPKPRLRCRAISARSRRRTRPWRRTRICEVDAPGVEWLFCENETNYNRLYGTKAPGPFKDGINDYVVNGRARRGQPAAARHQMRRPCAWTYPRAAASLRLRLRPAGSTGTTRSPGSTP